MALPEPQHPMAAAMQWVARIFAAAMLMVLPGLAGQWLDRQLSTRVFVLLGFGGGIAFGMAYLIAQTKQAEMSRKKRQSGKPPESHSEND